MGDVCETCGQRLPVRPSGLPGLCNKYRLKARMSTLDLANKLGLRSHTSIVNLEAGRQDLPLSRIVKMAEVLNIPDDELLKALKQTNKGEE